MSGTPTATWFVEVDGQKQGPYTSQQIVKLVMDGALKIESKIFDAATETWKIAADVIPYLDLGAQQPQSETGWTPPARPKEMRDTHVVESSESANDVDYYALISDRKKTQDRASQQGAGRSIGGARAQQEKPGPQEPQAPKKPLLSANRRADSSPAQTQPKSTIAEGLLIAQPESASLRIELGAKRFVEVFGAIASALRTNRTPISIAAALGLVFLGTYGAIKLLSQRKTGIGDREVAATTQSRPDSRTDARKTEPKPSSGDELGSGKHKIHRASGTIPPRAGMHAGNPSLMAPPINANPTDNNAEPPREAAQYYSSSEAEMPPQNAQPAYYPPPAATEIAPTSAALPPGGTVQPPGFIPPQTPLNPPAPIDPNDPNRYPTNETDTSQTLYSQ